MRTNIEIDDKLIKKALRASGEKTKKGAVEAGLRLLVEVRDPERIRELRGKVIGRAIWSSRGLPSSASRQ